ncbi:fructosamine kinase family protein [Alkalitalea saponilacus]|uniref:Fructosamine-3-kinase n=1 Tax=Alkalitalea saponilacus TaxID=889453 RepID=A0A1T5HS54_9BACT|nr:fructosamine kinase family protein [Alkalitalea saponilacus]ASB50020.1 fructosamine kinase [Alkalitalea saponilacus]SKC23467.1 Fructosamine-3-kinase [Alkalitalea saponilacus]
MDKNKLSEILEDEIVATSPLSGGCIANTQKVTTQSGKEYAVKTASHNKMFINEANGLRELRKANVIRVPEVLYADESCLVIEFIKEGSRNSGFFKKFGAEMAHLHQFKSDKFGFFEDNFIGSTPQKNIPEGNESVSWIDFYWNKRLRYQFDLAERNGYADNQFKRLFFRLEKKIPKILEGSEEPPVLLHGDLWSGNYMCDENGNAVIIDPAVYYGHREADLAMTKLFGGFGSDFYSSYHETFPLKPGHEHREGVYMLYHVLNHLNLFGTGYYRQAVSLMDKYL